MTKLIADPVVVPQTFPSFETVDTNGGSLDFETMDTTGRSLDEWSAILGKIKSANKCILSLIYA